MSETRALFTRADYDQLPQGFPAELLEGDLVREPAPFYRHQRVVVTLMEHLLPIVGRDRLVCSPIDVHLDDVNVLQPDVAVFAKALWVDLRHVPVPTLVIEVLSDSTARRDRGRKARVYLQHGVAEVWLIHPFDGTIEVCTSSGRTEHTVDAVVTSVALPAIAVAGADLIR